MAIGNGKGEYPLSKSTQIPPWSKSNAPRIAVTKSNRRFS